MRSKLLLLSSKADYSSGRRHDNEHGDFRRRALDFAGGPDIGIMRKRRESLEREDLRPNFWDWVWQDIQGNIYFNRRKNIFVRNTDGERQMKARAGVRLPNIFCS